ncbi:MAG TPA: ATP-grasp domain-containing protein [Steroidobacteraceae bacterium]|jgi:hypothetical protein|nr:ATP-grasp domain-containing protein [Steroidobacteraceae bacterium]
MRAADTILLWGLPTEAPIVAVEESLGRGASRVFLLDQTRTLETEFHLQVGRSVKGELRMGEECLDLARVKSIYLRPYDFRELPCMAGTPPYSEPWRKAVNLQDMLLSWCDVAPVRVLNRPTHMSANNSKPYQAQWIASLGFKTPCTLITTDAEAARQFWQHHGTIIYKSVSGMRSIVSRMSPEHAERMEDIASCPTQFQQYIAGMEYRVHVVGDELFACRIASEADDYRYSSNPVAMRPCRLPRGVAAACLKLARAMKLTLAGIDLRHCRDGDWYCLEVNPSPGFTYFERSSGRPVAKAIARLLLSDRPAKFALDAYF